MSLTIGSNFAAYPLARVPAQAASSGGTAVPGNLTPGAGQGQGGRGQIVDQVNITSITINIDQTASAASGSQLQVGVSKAIAPLANGGSALQPLGEGSEGVGDSSSADASEATLTLQILSEATDASAGSKSHPSGKADPATVANLPSENSSYLSVDISI